MTDQEVISLCPKAFKPFWKRSPIAFIIIIASFLYLLICISYFDFSITKIFSGLANMKPILGAMFEWNDFLSWNFHSIFIGLIQTLSMAFLGTFLASLVCMPISFFASRQINKFGFIRFIIKRILDFIRGIDILIWAIIYVRAFGLGPFAGLLSIFTADVGKFLHEHPQSIHRSILNRCRLFDYLPRQVNRLKGLP